MQELKVWHVMLNLGFVKVTRGYMKKAEPKPCLFHPPIIASVYVGRNQHPTIN